MGWLVGLAAMLAAVPTTWGQDLQVKASSYVGAASDAVVGAVIQSDGTIVLAANLSGGELPRAPLYTLSRGKGYLLRLSSDGTKLLSVSCVGSEVRDLDVDDKDFLYVAAGQSGVMRLDPEAKRILARGRVRGICARVDADASGQYFVALGYDNDEDTATGSGTIGLFEASGRSIGTFRGHRHTLDVCVDGESKTVIHIGWRQDNAFDGKRTFPVQIAYVRGLAFNGGQKYLLYDWSTKRDDPNFLNKPTNNMADTRGYRCSIGRDGKLYCGFEAAGGNHIFRYEPTLDASGEWQSAKDKGARGDQYHQFHNSRAEHKTVFARYEPGTGECLKWQQFTCRLDNGRANAVRVKNGAITADGQGRVYLGGGSASGLPMSFKPEDTGDYTGGAYLLAMESELDRRLFCTRVIAGGETRAIDARVVKGKLIVVMAGQTSKKAEEPLHLKDPLQKQAAASTGFVTVLHEKGE